MYEGSLIAGISDASMPMFCSAARRYSNGTTRVSSDDYTVMPPLQYRSGIERNASSCRRAAVRSGRGGRRRRRSLGHAPLLHWVAEMLPLPLTSNWPNIVYSTNETRIAC